MSHHVNEAHRSALFDPAQSDSVGWASSRKANVASWIPRQGTGLGCGPSPQWVRAEATYRCISHTSMFLSLSFSLPSPLSKDKYIKSLLKKSHLSAEHAQAFYNVTDTTVSAQPVSSHPHNVPMKLEPSLSHVSGEETETWKVSVLYIKVPCKKPFEQKLFY